MILLLFWDANLISPCVKQTAWGEPGARGPTRRLSRHTGWAVAMGRDGGVSGWAPWVQGRARTTIQEAVWLGRKSAGFQPVTDRQETGTHSQGSVSAHSSPRQCHHPGVTVKETRLGVIRPRSRPARHGPRFPHP